MNDLCSPPVVSVPQQCACLHCHKHSQSKYVVIRLTVCLHENGTCLRSGLQVDELKVLSDPPLAVKESMAANRGCGWVHRSRRVQPYAIKRNETGMTEAHIILKPPAIENELTTIVATNSLASRRYLKASIRASCFYNFPENRPAT